MNRENNRQADNGITEAIISDSPGQSLQKARKKYGLTIEEVATRLCLRHSVIEAIEADNYSGMSGFVFARGYLRAYARLLQVDADAVIDSFNALGLHDDRPNEGMLLQQTPRVVHQKESPVKWLFLLVALFSLILTFMWWSARDTKRGSEINLTAHQIVQPHAELSELETLPQRTPGAEVAASKSTDTKKLNQLSNLDKQNGKAAKRKRS